MPNLPIVPKKVTLRGNVGSLDATRASRLFTFGFGGRVLHREGRECSKKIRKNGETNGMLNLPIVPTHFTLTPSVRAPPGRGGHGNQLMYGPPRAGGVTLYCRFCTSDVKMFRFVTSFH